MASREEIRRNLTAIEVAFPAVFQNMDKRKMTAQYSLWEKMMKDVDGKALTYAVGLYIANDTSGFPPTIGRINEIIREAEGPAITEIEAWQMIKAAIKDSYDYESANRQYEKLPESVRAPVWKPTVLIEWANMPTEQVDSTISAAYRRSFLARQKRAQEQQALPAAIRNLLPELKRIE